MGLSIDTGVQARGVNSNFFINPIRQNNVSTPQVAPLKPDSISVSSDLSKYINPKAIEDMIRANPNITKILNEAKIPVKVNMKALQELSQGHLLETRNTTLGVLNNMPQDFKTSINSQALLKAAILHDFGKVLIPESILNKNDKLTDNEKAIMEKHSELGYELLKTTDLDKQTLELIKNHHQNAQKTGYPAVDETFVADMNTQILSASDMYSALREKRSYKDELSKNTALAIIHREVKGGKLHPYVFKALVDFANKEELKSKPIEQERNVNNFQLVNRLSA